MECVKYSAGLMSQSFWFLEFKKAVKMRQEGNDEGWKFREFWWPVLVAPKNTPKTVYALPDPAESIKK